MGRPTEFAKVPSIIQRRLSGDKPPKKMKLDTTPLITLPGNTKSQIIVHGRKPHGIHLSFESDDETFDTIPMSGSHENDYIMIDVGPSQGKKMIKQKNICKATSVSSEPPLLKKVPKKSKKLKALLKVAAASGLELTEQEAQQMLLSQFKVDDPRPSSGVASRKSTVSSQSLKKVKKKTKQVDRTIVDTSTSHHHVIVTEEADAVVMTVQHGNTGTLEKKERMYSSKDVNIPEPDEIIKAKKKVIRKIKKSPSEIDVKEKENELEDIQKSSLINHVDRPLPPNLIPNYFGIHTSSEGISPQNIPLKENRSSQIVDPVVAKQRDTALGSVKESASVKESPRNKSLVSVELRESKVRARPGTVVSTTFRDSE